MRSDGGDDGVRGRYLLIQAQFSELQRAGVMVEFSGEGNLSPFGVLWWHLQNCRSDLSRSMCCIRTLEQVEDAPVGHSGWSWKF
jgi:hypothetical protein